MEFRVDLPSKGQIKHIPASLLIKEWNLEDITNMSKATEGALDDTYTALLSKGIVRDGVDEKFNAGLLVDVDRVHLMLAMRVNVIGPSYEFDYTHRVPGKDETGALIDTCGETIHYKLDLIKSLTFKDIPSEYYNHVRVELPKSKQELRVCIPSYEYRREQTLKWEENTGKKLSDLPSNDDSVALFYTALYFSGMGDKRFSDIMEAITFVNSLHPQDAHAAIETATYFGNWGPDLDVTGTCPKCKGTYSFRVPLLNNFFFDPDQYRFDPRTAIKARQGAKH